MFHAKSHFRQKIQILQILQIIYYDIYLDRGCIFAKLNDLNNNVKSYILLKYYKIDKNRDDFQSKRLKFNAIDIKSIKVY